MVLLFSTFFMGRELQEYFNIGYVHAADVLEGVSFTATILENLRRQGIFDYANTHRAVVLGFGNGHELWLLQQLGISFILGVDDNSMPAWGVVREQVLTNIPEVHTETGQPFARWLQQFSGEPFDLMLATQAPAGFWHGVNWTTVAGLLSPGGVFIVDSDDDPAEFGFTPKLEINRCQLDFSIDFPPEVVDLTNGTTTIYEARERMGFKRNVIMITKQIPSDINEISPP